MADPRFDGVVPLVPGFGDTLATATATEFFHFFHLAEVERIRSSAGESVVFRPTGQYRALVRLRVEVGSTGKIGAVDLVLRRAFIDDPDTMPFARDIVKSLLLRLVGQHETDLDAVGWMLSQIAQAEEPAVVKRNGRLQPAAVVPPGLRTRGYMAFLGRCRRAEQELTGTLLSLENVQTPEGPELVVAIGRRPRRSPVAAPR